MKQLFISLLIATSLFTQAASARNLLEYTEVIQVSDYKGQTFLSLMKEAIKPALDEKATGGFQVASGDEVAARWKLVESKVAKKAISAAGSLANLRELADQLHDEYESISFYDLPAAIASAGYPKGQYDLATFLSLVSHGGVAVQFDRYNISYNVNYGTGENQNDERTGRSFGESHDRYALDASDKHYLSILQDYVQESPDNLEQFYTTLLSTLLNSDTTGFNKITKAGQAVATDFLAVYIAEQDRHLMSNFTKHPWDEALLEVTLLAAFHAGQEKIHIMYGGELTDVTHAQTTGCSEVDPREKEASLVDYWQFSSSTDPANCSRSGINITRKDFRALGAKITAHQREVNPALVKKIEKLLGVKNSRNLFADLSGLIINLETPDQLNEETLELVQEFTQFLMEARDSAEDLTQQMVTK